MTNTPARNSDRDVEMHDGERDPERWRLGHHAVGRKADAAHRGGEECDPRGRHALTTFLGGRGFLFFFFVRFFGLRDPNALARATSRLLYQLLRVVGLPRCARVVENRRSPRGRPKNGQAQRPIRRAAIRRVARARASTLAGSGLCGSTCGGRTSRRARGARRRRPSAPLRSFRRRTRSACPRKQDDHRRTGDGHCERGTPSPLPEGDD